jgi:hypothetical protein
MRRRTVLPCAQSLCQAGCSQSVHRCSMSRQCACVCPGSSAPLAVCAEHSVRRAEQSWVGFRRHDRIVPPSRRVLVREARCSCVCIVCVCPPSTCSRSRRARARTAPPSPVSRSAPSLELGVAIFAVQNAHFRVTTDFRLISPWEKLARGRDFPVRICRTIESQPLKLGR